MTGSVDKIFSWGVMYYIHPKFEYCKYQTEFIRILKPQWEIFDFQIPLRYGWLFNQFDLQKSFFKLCLMGIKKSIFDIFLCNFAETSYKYSTSDLRRLRSSFSSIIIIPDDFFKGRISVVYKK